MWVIWEKRMDFGFGAWGLGFYLPLRNAQAKHGRAEPEIGS
jgi:hypothetical protein